MFSAILLGLDATPPLYTGYGWFMLHYFAPAASPELLLRITNAALIGATLWILYLLVRRYFDQVTALTTMATFTLLELWHLKFLTLEMRTYAAIVFFTTLTIYAALRAIARPSWTSLTCTMLAYCLLVSSHPFGIIYALSVVSCTMLATAAEGNIRLAVNSGLAAVPAIVMFFLWVPVLHEQSQLGSWISRPNFFVFIRSTYPPELLHRTSLLAVLLAALILLWRFAQSRKGPLLTQWWRSTNRLQTFAIVLPIAFGASTFAVWLFSRLVFPVFVERYFFPNIILHIIWLSVLVDFVFTYLTPSTIRYGLVLVAAVVAGLSIKYRQFDRGTRIPCFDSSQRVYFEDPFGGDKNLIVANSLDPWLTRQNRPGERVVFPIDESAPKKNTEFPPYVYERHFAEAFAKWSDVNTVMTTSQILNTKQDFMVLEEMGWGWWLEYIQQRYRVELTPLTEGEGCTLWRVRVVE
jgi:hypothetical protein